MLTEVKSSYVEAVLEHQDNRARNTGERDEQLYQKADRNLEVAMSKPLHELGKAQRTAMED
jgi:hypothetical protein